MINYNGIPLEMYFSPKDDAMHEIVAEVNAATTSIDFSIFFSTDDDLKDAMVTTHNRGVQIRELWNPFGCLQRLF